METYYHGSGKEVETACICAQPLSYLVVKRMKITSSGLFCCFVLALLCSSPTPVTAQNSNTPTNPTTPTTPDPDLPIVAQGVQATTQPASNDTGPTNAYQIETNNALYQSFGPTAPGSGQAGSPYLGTSALAGSPHSGNFYVPTTPGIPIWGPIQAYPHLLYSLTYGNGFQSQPGVNSSSLVDRLAPGVLLKLGDHWTLDYTPTLVFYTTTNFQNTTDQQVVLRGSATYSDWRFIFTQSYIDTTQPILETGTQIEQTAYATVFNATYQMGSKTSLESILDQTFRFTTDLTDLHEWSDSEWLNYQALPQLGTALGVSAGYNELSVGSDLPFEKVNGRVTFRPGTKLSLTVEGGAEETEFIHPHAPSTLNPIFDLSAVYLFRDRTTLTLTAARTVVPSLFQNELNVTTILTGDFHMPVALNWSFDLTASYTSEPFTSIVPGPVPPGFYPPKNLPTTFLDTIRTDTRTSVRVSLSRIYRRRFTGTIFYLYSDNNSSQSAFNYSGNQFGLELSYKY